MKGKYDWRSLWVLSQYCLSSVMVKSNISSSERDIWTTLSSTFWVIIPFLTILNDLQNVCTQGSFPLYPVAPEMILGLSVLLHDVQWADTKTSCRKLGSYSGSWDHCTYHLTCFSGTLGCNELYIDPLNVLQKELWFLCAYIFFLSRHWVFLSCYTACAKLHCSNSRVTLVSSIEAIQIYNGMTD